jgi:hypothetical protein
LRPIAEVRVAFYNIRRPGEICGGDLISSDGIRKITGSDNLGGDAVKSRSPSYLSVNVIFRQFFSDDCEDFATCEENVNLFSGDGAVATAAILGFIAGNRYDSIVYFGICETDGSRLIFGSGVFNTVGVSAVIVGNNDIEYSFPIYTYDDTFVFIILTHLLIYKNSLISFSLSIYSN